MPIQALPDHVVAQIAAGEVVERPASVVKELLENALDAGAGHIIVATQGGGQKLIRVSDDGSGIRAHEVELAFGRHTTSKLRTAEDLLTLRTLGFRGEALCSIASVSHVTCLTRHRDEPNGLRLRLEASTVTAKQAAGAPAGTVITVENLFYNVPARLKFLKKEATEKRQIQLIVMLYAMAYPHVRFTLEQDGREAFRANGSGKLADVLVAAYGVDTFKQLLPIESALGGIRVTGYTTRPDTHRANRDRIHIFANGRAIQDHSLVRAVTEAYRGLLSEGQYPVSVLMVDVPPEDVDVNVHPTKAEVRFKDSGAVFQAIQRAVREAVIGTAGIPVPAPQRPVSPAARAGLSPSPARLYPPRITPDDDVPSDIPNEDAPESDDEPDVSHIPEGLGLPERPRTLPVLRVLGQMGQQYIIAEGPASMFLIDQHAAHQRVLYYSITSRIESGTPIPLTEDVGGMARLTPAQARQLEDLAPVLCPLGLSIEAFGPNVYRVASAPRFLAGLDAETVIHAVLRAMFTPTPDITHAVLAALCKLGAVQVGTPLSSTEQQSLIRELERTYDPFTAPDGSTVLIELTSEHLAREFRRRP
jgi:DNA mismatch repair protein MutL